MTHSLNQFFGNTLGERIRCLREYLSITRKEFGEKHGFPVPTIASWELSKTVLTSYSLQKLIHAFAQENIILTEEWLQKGTGEHPRFVSDSLDKEIEAMENELSSQDSPSLHALTIEIAVFRKYHPSSVVVNVADKAMSPLYEKGDFVGGIKIDINSSLKFGETYIIKLEKGLPLIRTIYQGKEKSLFTLSCTNLHEMRENPVIANVKIKEIYEIIWHRKNK